MVMGAFRRYELSSIFSVCLTVIVVACVPATAQTGHVLEAVGPVNQSMGGAAVAMPIDGMGAMHWNAASITALPSSEIGFAFAAFNPSSTLSSRVDAGAFGPGFPAATMEGSTTTGIDIAAMPAFAFVYVPDDSPWAYGLSGFAIGGFGVDYPASNPTTPGANPILTPQPPNGMGFGALQSNFQMLQITAAVSCRLTERLSVGVAPTFDWTSLAVTPFPGTTPDDANGDGFPSYPSGARGDARWGLGVQVGVFYENPESGWNLGFSYKTTQWIDKYRINSADELGMPRLIEFDLDFPAVLSMGVGYTGFDCWDLAFDARYIDYANTDGFGTTGFLPDGSVPGFGWDSIWTFSFGTQYHLSESIKVRGGYTFNESPLSSDVSFFNVQACAIVQHHLNCGLSWETPHGWILSMAYHHGFEGSVSGPMYGPTGPVPGTNVRSDLKTDTFSGGITKRF